MKKTIIISIVIILAIAWYFYSSNLNRNKESENNLPITSTESSSLNIVSPAEKIEKISNPLKNNIPDINPAGTANPFKDAYKNPFE